MNILDQSIAKYIFKRRSSEQTEIKNGSEEFIGIVIHSKNFKILHDVNEKIILKVEKKQEGTIRKHQSFEIRGNDDKVLGIVSRNPLNQSTTENHLQLIGNENNVILDTFLPQIGLKEKITDQKEKEVASILVKEVSDPSRHEWILQISDLLFDRRLTLGIFLSVFEEEPKEYHEFYYAFSGGDGRNLSHPMEFGKNS